CSSARPRRRAARPSERTSPAPATAAPPASCVASATSSSASATAAAPTSCVTTGSGSSGGRAGTGATAVERAARLTRTDGRAIVRAMPSRRGLALLLVVVTLLVTGVAAAHTHDSAEAGLYNTQCPLQEAAGHATALPLTPPA